MVARPLGWVQNPSSFDSLKRVVQVFCPNTDNYNYLLKVIPKIVHDEAVENRLLAALNSPAKISYLDLVGTGSTPRAKAPCDSLVQASIPSQKATKPYIDNWSSDGFVRWAECLGFIEYNPTDDTFSVTKVGEEFARTTNRQIVKGILIERMFTYPPAIRVLGLLYDADQKFLRDLETEPNASKDPFIHAALTKYEIGSQLGFNGENGFTSYSSFYISRLMINLPEDLTIGKIRSDIEGSSDKYARMIASWLEKLGLVRKVQLGVDKDNLGRYYMRTNQGFGAWYCPDSDSQAHEWYISHSYQITVEGAYAYKKQVLGPSTARNPKLPLHVTWNMLATKASPTDLLRTRRSMILKLLERRADYLDPADITQYLIDEGIEVNLATVKADLEGLEGIGIQFAYRQANGGKHIKLVSQIEGLDDRNFDIRAVNSKDFNLEARKQSLRDELFNIDAKHIELIELAYDSRQNRLFESKIIDILNSTQSAFKGKWLGGARKPDGVVWNDYCWTDGICLGTILDAKAYSKGYGLDIKQADQMYRYIEECLQRDVTQNPNQWWNEYPFLGGNHGFAAKKHEFSFLFVTSEVTGNGYKNAETLASRAQINGRIADAETFLRALSHIARRERQIDYDVTAIQKVFPFSESDIHGHIALNMTPQ
ncbi:MAG: restriction endonuclease FokI C-terminal domain-containing protein [Pseudomonadota bacterium]|nr:restriction endonuclease FokI C-terminal domain-containing protein [Pseudomonadota bacterium]